MAANLHNNLRARMNAMPQRPPPHQNPYRANQQPPQRPAGPAPAQQQAPAAPPNRPPPPHRPAPAGGAPPRGPPPGPAGGAPPRGPPPHGPAPAGGAPPRGPPPHRPAPAGRAPPRGPPPRAGPRARAAAPPRGPPPGRRAGAPPPPLRPVPAAHVPPAGIPPMPPVPPPYVRPGIPAAPQIAVIPGTGMFPAPPPPDAVPGAVPLHQAASGHGGQQQQQQDEKDDGILANQFILNDIIHGISNFDESNAKYNVHSLAADRRQSVNHGLNLNTFDIHLRSGRASPMDQIYDNLNRGRARRNNPLAGSEEEVKQRAQDSYRLQELKNLVNKYTKNGGGQDVADRLFEEINNIEKKINQKRGYLNNSYGPSRGTGLSMGDYGDNTRMLHLYICNYFLSVSLSLFPFR